MTDEERLRVAYGELLAARAPAGRDGCPPPEALLRLVEREGPEDARLATLDHVLGCTKCDPRGFPSYRRDGKGGGRIVAAIVAR